MTIEEVYQYFGSAYAAAKAIGITKQSFTEWIEKRFIPFKRQIQIEKITKGKLIAKEEDAKKSNPKEIIESESNYLPNFRYYDKKNGMCKVESIHFRKGNPKITYIMKGTLKKNISFEMENLMQASGVVDFYSNLVFEGDILKLKNGKTFIFKSMDEINKLKKLGKFKIIGNIFDDR